MLDPIHFDQLFNFYKVLLGLSPTLRGLLQTQAQLIHAPAGHVLFEAGRPCEHFIFVLKGSLRVVQGGSQGREILLYRVAPGEMCVLSLCCLLNHVDFPALAVVEDELMAARLSRGAFFEFVDASQAFRFYILRFYAAETLRLLQLLEGMAFGSLERRLAGLLLRQGNNIEITHQILADELGSRREVISRVLESLEEQGILLLERGRITILDRAALSSIAKIA